ncbi:MAG: hypothetical protein R3E01_34990 [Pirellulaceae bacterium]|nr:hypothetical protein [Planctomycetales bacterium]
MKYGLPTLSILAIALLAFLSAAGCARQVLRTADYGVVAIPSNTNVWPLRYRTKAEKIMGQHFPEGYVIEREQEEVVGQKIQTDDSGASSTIFRKGPFAINLGSSHTTSTVTDEREWHIHYRRK